MPKAIPSLIQVLWVEDDPAVTETYPLEAANCGIQLVPYSCWDEADDALESEFNRWSAIVLDAKCKQHKDSTDNASRFLVNALEAIKGICTEKHHIIPWYVLSGGAENEIQDLISDSRKQWDGDWPKSYYEKSKDRDFLYRRLRARVNRTPAIQILDIYKNVFSAIEECKISDDVYGIMEDLLVPINFPEVLSDDEYNNKFKDVRIVLENIFRSMMSHGFLPETPKVNLQWSSLILSGMSVTKKIGDKKETIVEVKDPVLPKVLRDAVKLMIFAAGSDVHSNSDEENHVHTHEYLSQVENSSFLLKSFALQLCDIILWYKGYVKSHSSKEENAKNWVIKDEERFYNR